MPGEMSRYAWRELRRRKSRTVVTILGYVLAVSVTVGLLAVMLSRRAADRVLCVTGTHFVACAPADASPGAAPPLDYVEPGREGLISPGNHAILARLLSAEVLDAVRRLPTVKDASGAILFRFRDPTDGHAFSAAGIDPAGSQAVGTSCCAPRDVLRGRFLDPKGEAEVMVEEAYAQAHRLEVGQTLRVAARPFSVVGIVNSGMRAVKADVYLGLAQAEKAVLSRVKDTPSQRPLNVLLVEAVSSEARENAAGQVQAIEPRLVISGYACYLPALQVLGMNESAIRNLVVLVAMGVILFAAVSQIVSVAERRGDIGVLKAIGWSSGEVVALLMVESIFQGMIGGLLGSAAAGGGLAASAAAIRASTPAAVAGDLLLIGEVLGTGMLMAVLSGALAGAIPALLSVRISPAEAIRRL